jgi:hypothetical protein
MENIQLQDLVYEYPNVNDEEFQEKISAKEEFRELLGSPSEAIPKSGELFRHQKVLKRLMSQYDNQLIIWGTGVGKSGGMISICEYYKSLAGALEDLRKISNDVPNTPYKRAYVLVRGDALINEFKYQIVCKSGGDYINEKIINSKTESQRKQNVSRSVAKFYSIMTYGAFAKMVFALTDEQLINEFSHCIFIVDEVHNISHEKSEGVAKVDPITGNKYYMKMKKGKEKIDNKRLIYDQLFRVFHIVYPRKVMLASATPMINDASELGPRLNLILPLNRQIPDNINWNTVTLETLKRYFNGLISYVRALDTGAIIKYEGEPLNKEYEINGKNVLAQLIVYKSEMEEKQNEVYEIAVNDPQKLRPESDKPEAFDDLKRQAANFVFPDNTVGSQGYKKYVIEEKNDYVVTPELKVWLQDMKYLRQLSIKFFKIIDLCKNEPGNCWIYSNYIEGSGAVVLAAAFEAQGFEKFSENTSIFTDVSTGGLSALCGSKSLDEKKERLVKIPKKLRYALLTSKTTAPEAAALVEAFNSTENLNGEYIKAIIGSPFTQEGLNFANALQVHLLSSEWNEATSYQAISRAIRSTSHVDVILQEQERLIALGMNPEEAVQKATVEIKVYRHAAISRDEENNIDIEMYERSEMKDRQIKRIMRMMKQCATDCQINYARNVRRNDIDYSATCDYDICQYQCINKSPDYIDTSSYDVLYSKDVIKAIESEIIDIFRITFKISYNELYSELEGYQRRFVDIAVNNLIENKTSIYNRYGYLSYLREDKGILFLTNDFPLSLTVTSGSSDLWEYTSSLLGVNFTTLTEYNGTLQRGQGNILDMFKGLDREEVVNKIESLTLENQILLLETAIVEYYLKGEKALSLQWILEKFANHIFFENEPVKALEIVKLALSQRGTGRGRKPKPGSKFKLNESKKEEVLEALQESRKKKIVYFHNLSNLSEALTSYNISSKSTKSEGKIRLLKPQENIGWRDGNEAEEIVYNLIISEKKKEVEMEDEIYGTILEDGAFRIIDKTTEDISSGDNRKKNRGKKCVDGWRKPGLIKLMWKINYDPFVIEVNLNRREISNYLISQNIVDAKEIEDFSDEKLIFFYKWASSGANIKRICELLQKHFEQTGKIYRQ